MYLKLTILECKQQNNFHRTPYSCLIIILAQFVSIFSIVQCFQILSKNVGKVKICRRSIYENTTYDFVLENFRFARHLKINYDCTN